MRNALAGVFLLLLLCAPASQAAINKPLPFNAEFPFSPGFEAGSLRIVSGRLDADIGSAEGTWGFFDTQGAVITGLRQACWAPTQCTQSGTDDVAITVSDGGSFGLSLPGEADATLAAAHAMGLFIDFGDEEDLNSLALGRSLVAPLVEGEMAFTRITPIPSFTVVTQDEGGGITALDETTTINVYRGDTLVESSTGKVDPIVFSGSPRVAPFALGSAVLPFEGASAAYFSAAPEAAARQGLALDRVQSLSQELQAAQAGGQGGAGGEEVDLGGFDKLLAEVMNGAVLGLPNGASGNASFADSFVFVRFTSLAVRTDGGSGLLWEGRAPLQVQEGHVKEAKPLYGFAYLALPWWSYVLWGIAIAVLVVRIVLRAPKKNERWDRLRWIGWVASPVAFIIVFLLWDHETKAVWGTSILSTEASGQAWVVTALIELVPLSLVMFAAAAPLRMMLRNGLMLAKQGTFMGLSGAVAALVGYLIGAHLMLSYLELILVQVIEQLG